MKTLAILLTVAMVCLAVSAKADVRALYDMNEDPASPMMHDSSGYGNDLWVGDSTGIPNPNSVWSSPVGAFTPWDGAAWHAIAGRDIGFELGTNTLQMGVDNYLSIEFDIQMAYAGDQQLVVAHNSSADYGVFTKDIGGAWNLEYASWDAPADSWVRWFDTTALPYNQWIHAKVTVTAGSDAAHRTLSFYVGDMINPTSAIDIGNNGGGGTNNLLESGGYLIAGPTNWGKYLMGRLDNLSIDITPIPEPSIMLVGLAALLLRKKK